MADFTPDLSALDQALGALVNSGWNEPQGGLDAGLPAPLAEPMPEPVRQAAENWLQESREPQPHGGALKRVEYTEPAIQEGEGSEVPTKALMDVGLLSDLVSGAMSPEQAAGQAGVTLEQLHSALATTLAAAGPGELSKALGVQVATSQLKATAVWNAILSDLVADMRAGRVKPEVKIELMKLLARIGRLEPKEDRGPGAGGGFQLNINIGEGAKPVVIESQ